MKNPRADTLGLLKRAADDFYEELQREPDGRCRSWERCYEAFYKARKQDRSSRPDELIDELSLQLAFYLASLGMYRGSSFLLQKDDTIHRSAVRTILEPRYDPLFGIACVKLWDEKNQELLAELYGTLEKHYGDIRNQVKGGNSKSKPSPTLITKILMGTLGCVPGYDRYFAAGIKKQKAASGAYSLKSVLSLVDFYETHDTELEAVREKFRAGASLRYPQMKLLDIGFWKIGYGYEADH